MEERGKIKGFLGGIGIVLVLLFSSTGWTYDYYSLPGIKGYQPPDPEAFPWKEPWTGEMFQYHLNANRFTGYLYLGSVLETYINNEGHIRQNILHPGVRWGYKEWDYADRLKYYSGNVKEGEVAAYLRFFWVFPPEIYGMGFMQWDYLDTPKLRKDTDRWLYAAGLRRIRRMAGADRADTLSGGDFTYDEIVGKEAFEWEYKIIGTDILYPEESAHNTKVYEYTGWYPKIVEYKAPTGPMECVVVEGRPKLPDYYISKSITWFYKWPGMKAAPYVDIREEHYDLEGYLWRIRVRGWGYYNGTIVPGARTTLHPLEQIRDIKINHRTLYHFKIEPIPFAQADKYLPTVMFKPEAMMEERDIVPPVFREDFDKKWPLFKEIVPLLPDRPPVLKYKFPEHRKIKEDILQKPWVQEDLKKEEEWLKKRGK